MQTRVRAVVVPLAALLAPACAVAPSVQTASEESPWSHRLVDPVTAPTLFESATIQTNVEPILMSHDFPSDSIFQGGGAEIFAVQGRLALNDRLALIAVKDGYIDIDPGVGASESGLADIGGGVKYALHEDREQGFLVTPGLIFETTSGDRDVFQGNGDGVVRPFVSGAWDGGALDVQAAVGIGIPLDSDAESTVIDYHAHVSYEVAPGVHPLVEINGLRFVSSGEALPVDFEGGDLINLGASMVSGNTQHSGAIGVRWRVTDWLQLGGAYEVPLGGREDILDSRITLDAVFTAR